MPAGRVPVVLARLNTVSRVLPAETRASGELNGHPFAGQDAAAVIDELAEQLLPWRDIPAVRIVLMHHPPHRPPHSGGAGSLDGADELAEALGELCVQLVIAGHFHTLDPPRGASRGSSEGSQPPLVPPTAQLVCESPTQASVRRIEDGDEYADLVPRSFSRYRLWADTSECDVERVVYRYNGQGRFIASASETVLTGLPLA
jgi:hypothetical protein